MRARNALGLVLVASALLSSGCSSSNKGKIEGTKWTSQATTVKKKAIPGGALNLEFTTDGRVVYRVAAQTFTGKYTLGMGDRVTLHLDQALSNGKVHSEKIVINGTSMTMTDPDGTTISFTKLE